MSHIIYLDSAATALPVAHKAQQSMRRELYFNPSALYAREAVKELDISRQQIKELLGFNEGEIYFTSGATEANNIAIFGGTKNKSLSAITSMGEHASVHESFVALKNMGYKINMATLSRNIHVNADEFIELASNDCGFASLIHASNETGALNNIDDIFTEVKKRNKNIILHSDGVQAFLKTPLLQNRNAIDIYTISGHKIGANKGVGAIYVRQGINLKFHLFGGMQEGRLRPGTQNIASVIEFRETAKQFKKMYCVNKIKTLRDTFKQALFKELQRLSIKHVLHSKDSADFLTNIITMSIIGLKGEVLQRVLATKDQVYIGLGSACAASKNGNRVLEASGKTKQEIDGSIRISLGLELTREDILLAAQKISLRIGEILGGQIG